MAIPTEGGAAPSSAPQPASIATAAHTILFMALPPFPGPACGLFARLPAILRLSAMPGGSDSLNGAPTEVMHRRGRGPKAGRPQRRKPEAQRPREAPRPTGFLSCAALARLIPALGACAGQPPLPGAGSARCGLPFFGALSFLSIATSLDQRMAAAECRSNLASIGHIRENSPWRQNPHPGYDKSRPGPGPGRLQS
ncbi:Uncharacterised protein [Bordetella trematum]|nr:Uncharacterised protein [Bordetella trematum]